MGFLDIFAKIGSVFSNVGVGGITAIIPLLVAAVEKIFPGAKGTDKLSQVLSIVRLLFPDFFKDLPQETVDEFLDGLIEVVSGSVKLYHAIGVFTHKDD